MIDVRAREVPVNRFFETNDSPPGNVFIMRVTPRPLVDDNIGLCQNIQDESYWRIHGDRYVRLLPPETGKPLKQLRLFDPDGDPPGELARQCDKPPAGWRCSREPGHEGPCAAWPVNA